MKNRQISFVYPIAAIAIVLVIFGYPPLRDTVWDVLKVIVIPIYQALANFVYSLLYGTTKFL